MFPPLAPRPAACPQSCALRLIHTRSAQVCACTPGGFGLSLQVLRSLTPPWLSAVISHVGKPQPRCLSLNSSPSPFSGWSAGFFHSLDLPLLFNELLACFGESPELRMYF